ncbi:MAG: N-6 DNA methylase [Aquificaceae bacterium]
MYLNTLFERRKFGAYLTPIDVFKKFIFSEIKDLIYQYTWIDLFAGEGNLILPILEEVPKDRRVEFFRNHIFLFDIQKSMVEKAIENARKYGIPYDVAKRNIQVRDTLKNYPDIKQFKYPVYHITNPPYLYLGYIVKHSKEYLKYFSNINEGYQDLYQIALINDLRNGVEKMVYIIPTNFLFGYSISNKIREDFLKFYTIRKAVIFEKQVFEHTGTNVCICFFERKREPKAEPVIFKAIKVNSRVIEKEYRLLPQNFYRAGSEFEEFVSKYKVASPLKVEFYLTLEEVLNNKGSIEVKLLDANSYKITPYLVNKRLYEKLRKNPLFVRTLDTGDWNGRVGIYNLKEAFGVDGIVVSKAKYRTHPIQIFILPELKEEDLDLLKDYFNFVLEYLRNETDSEFLTTYKYSNSSYTRKYLGLTQVKKLLDTAPIHLMSKEEKRELRIFIDEKDINAIKKLLEKFRRKL